MGKTVYVLDPDPADRAWITSALASHVDRVVFIDDIDALPAHSSEGMTDCLIVSAEPVNQGAVKAVRELREMGNTIATIALGSHAAFRSAVEIARMEATDFLERPVSDRKLRQAVQRMCKARA